MNPYLHTLKPYPFERLNALIKDVQPDALSPISFSIGEPKHPTPAFIQEALLEHLHELAVYPRTAGTPALRTAIAHWLETRFNLSPGHLDPTRHILPVNGSREALFSFAQSVLKPGDGVLMPNPFYQIYEGAALLAGATPIYANDPVDSPDLFDLDAIPAATWRQCQLVYLCTPSNPTGKVASEHWLQQLIHLAHEHDFIIASDECYSDIYLNENQPPLSLLEVCERLGHHDFSRCMVFHSLSKRSNAPGLRSGFVAGDSTLIQSYLLYRTYHGCAMAPPVQEASLRAWQDVDHARRNRDAYRRKFALAQDILGDILPLTLPAGGFYLWTPTPIDDVEWTRALYAAKNVLVLPGQFLSRDSSGTDPGRGRARIALVATEQECAEGLQRIRDFLQSP